MIPEYVFDKTWQEANFIIPTDDRIREKLRKKLEGFTHYGVIHLLENQKAKAVLLSRIAAIEAYEAKMPKAKEQVSNQIESRRERIDVLSAELIESKETFPFPGIDSEAYLKLKADINGDKDRSLYDISSPTIDELVERFKNEGMKVTLGDTPEAGNVFIIPAGSADIQSDSLFPKHLQAGEVKNKLEELVLLKRQVKSFAIRS